MASEIRVDKINSLSGVGTVTLSPTGVDISGITTAATLRSTTGIVTTLTATSSAKVGSGVTLSPDGDIFATGVCTATSFVGSGANLTGITGTTINTNADNRVITGSGTANTLNGEANLTFGSDLLNISSTTQALGLRLTNTGNEYTNIQFSAARTGADSALGILNAKWDNNHEVAAIYMTSGDDTTNKDDGKIKFATSAASGSIATRMEILNDGNVKVNDGDLVIGTSGHGIDFSATANGSGTMSSELFDDYEEGTWVPDARDGSLSYERANYTKIGRMVYLSAYLYSFSDNSTNDSVTIQGKPFAASVESMAVGSVMYQQVSDANKTTVYLSTTGFVFYGGDTGGYGNVRYNELSGSSSFYFQATYFAS